MLARLVSPLEQDELPHDELFHSLRHLTDSAPAVYCQMVGKMVRLAGVGNSMERIISEHIKPTNRILWTWFTLAKRMTVV
jgi:hypothetical protein